ncbi:hypothetical protein WJX73_009794 [Symbiochloris irregularis]|uniref:Phospholipid/glycerol acyltransferase domain-containing protein n=1 Tax=Symbiochloris irregularis TaxID=706552 RepID=A0AAW1NYL3_9CHLO
MTLSASLSPGRGNAVYQPDSPASTSMAVDAFANGVLHSDSGAHGQSHKRPVTRSQTQGLANGHTDLEQHAQPRVLVHNGRSFPLPPGLTDEQYQLIRESPFLDLDSPMTAYEWFKLVLFMPYLLIRICLIILLMPPCWLFGWVITRGAQPNQPLPVWRENIIRPFARFWALILLWLGMNFYFSVKGQENIPEARKEKAMITINHASYVDALALGQVFVPCGLAKSSVINVPFFGTFAVMLQFLFVERRNSADKHHNKSQKGSVTALIHERNADSRYPLFLMMPEGTTKGSNTLLPFSSGAFAFGRPVLPVLMHYRSKHFNVGWGAIQSIAFHILRMQAQFINHLTIEILPVYYPSPEEQKDARLYAENVRRYMAEKLGAKLTTHGMKEHSELKKARVCVDWTGKRIIQLPPKAAKGGNGKTVSAKKNE